MIRNVVLHITNEQPLRADLFEAPSADHVGLRCTNLRTMAGKRPAFIDDSSSIFFVPFVQLRFLEIPPGAISGSDPALAVDYADAAAEARLASAAETEPDLEIDEDFLRRIREA